MKAVLARFTIVLCALVRGYTKQQILWLLAQANHETGDFTAKYWYSDRNMFGMSEMNNQARRTRLAGVRLGGDGLMRAQFRNLFGSILDRLDWDKQVGVTSTNYGEQVSEVYHTNPNYNTQVNNRISSDLQIYYYATLLVIPAIIILIITFK